MDELLKQLDQALYTRYDRDNGCVLVWHGKTTILVLDMNGKRVHEAMVGLSKQKTVEAIMQHIIEKNYCAEYKRGL